MYKTFYQKIMVDHIYNKHNVYFQGIVSYNINHGIQLPVLYVIVHVFLYHRQIIVVLFIVCNYNIILHFPGQTVLYITDIYKA